MTKVSSITLDTKELDKITARLKPRAKRIVKTSAFAVEADAKIFAPVDTHALQNSLNARQVDPMTWQITDGVEYGIHQELGFHHPDSGKFIQNPFMVPAMEKERPNFWKAWKGLFK